MDTPVKPICPTRLLTDAATGDDSFQHKSIAAAIAEMVLSQDGGCAIALEGSWGSGKSTTVEILKEKLKQESANIQTFVFDVWAHESDPLRRSFLEKLIHWSSEELGWTRDKERWNGVVEELAKRKEVLTSRSVPNLKPWGAVSALLLLTTPVALALFQKIHFKYHPVWETAAAIMSAAPFLVGLALFAWWAARGRSKPFPSVFVTSTESLTTSETSKTADPTSVEFEKCYRTLLTEALEGNERKILLVVDNLDRVNREDARSIWASLRVFFDPSLRTSCDWYKRVWVLVPYDPDGISALWNANPAGNTGTNVVAHFLEKTFQATFRVPPIIQSNWKDFFLRMLSEAFPQNHSDEEFHAIYRLYDSLRPEPANPPTPRNLKLFVNELGALHRQWQDQITLPVQAAFVLLLTNHGNGLPTKLRDPDTSKLLPITLRTLLDGAWRRDITALYFNVPPQVANQVLLYSPISRAISEGDGKPLISLEQIPGFPEVIETAIEDVRTNLKPANSLTLSNAAIAFSVLQRGAPQYEYCRKQLWEAALSVKQWNSFGPKVASGLNFLVSILPTNLDLSPIIQSFTKSIDASNRLGSDGKRSQWCEGVAVALPELVKRDKESVLKLFRIEGEPAEYLATIREAYEFDPLEPFAEFMRPKVAIEAVLGFLRNRAHSGGWNEEDTRSVWAVDFYNSNVAWDGLATEFQSRIVSTALSVPNDVKGIIETLFFLSRSNGMARTALSDAARSGFLFLAFQSLTRSSAAGTAAKCVLAILSEATPITVQPQQFPPNTPQWHTQQAKRVVASLIGNPDSNQAVLSEMASECLSWLPCESWRAIAETRAEARKMVDRILRDNLSADENPESKISAGEIGVHRGYWRTVLGENQVAKILDLMAKSGQLEADLSARPFPREEAELHILSLSKKMASDAYEAHLASSLSECTEQQWSSAMSGETSLITLALRLSNSGLVLGKPFQDALAAHAESKLSGGAPGPLAREWEGLLQLLDGEGQAVFEQRLWNHFSSDKGSVAGLLPYYHSTLSRVVLERGPGDAFERVLEIIASENQPEIVWLTSVLSQWKARGKKATPIRNDWRERAAQAIQTAKSEQLKSALTNLLDAI